MNALRLDRFQVSEIEIENTLEALQNEVGGYIEVVMLSDKAAMIAMRRDCCWDCLPT